MVYIEMGLDENIDALPALIAYWSPVSSNSASATLIQSSGLKRLMFWSSRFKAASLKSALATFYKWAKRNNKVQEDPIYQIEKPKRPRRIPVWLETEEQDALMKATRNYDDIPDNVFGRSRAFSMAVRQRYELLFELIQKSGLRISEALGLKVQHIRIVDGVAKHVRVVGKGNKERLVPLPEAFGRVLALSLAGKTQDDYVFAKKPGGANRPAPMRPERI
jgi:site-specific recombinase XerD